MDNLSLFRDLINLLDKISNNENIGSCGSSCDCDSCSGSVDDYEATHDVDSEEMRFRQVYDMINNIEDDDYANVPNEVTTDVDTVTTRAGGGLNGSKHPDDIRVKDPRQDG